MVKMAIVLLLGSMLAGCPDDEEGVPTCEELGVPPEDNLLCNREGMCRFEGVECTRE